MRALTIRTLIFICMIFWAQMVHSQYYILGRALDDEEQPYSFATAELRGEGIFKEQICTELGVFRFEDLPSGSYELVVITPYGIRRKKIELRGSVDITLHISRNIQINEISVVAKRAGSNEPVTHDNITAEELQINDTGQDMPYLLEGTPSLVTTSDAGHGIGYTGLRIRGTDPTRINVTLNGIPVNDAESHNVFWVDLPDIASNTTNIQIHRGIGWSQPGTGDLGAGIHLNTMNFNYDAYAGTELGMGSFDTRRATLHAGSGLIKGRYTVDGRATYIHSGGFIDRAESNLYSIYGTAGYHHDETNLRIIYMLGDELTYQAWNGVPQQYAFTSDLRTYNSAGTEKSISDPHSNEVDDYRQNHLQLHYDQALTPFARWTTVLHYTGGKGFFEQYKSNQPVSDYGFEGTGTTDLIRRLWLDNDFYGFTSTMQIGSASARYLILGGGWSNYSGDHFGTVNWTEQNLSLPLPHQYYFNEAEKRDWNLFARNNLRITEKLYATIDLQARWIRYEFEGPDHNGLLTDQSVQHRFFNPKFGLSYQISGQSLLYALTGMINKEPNRDDYINSTPLSRPGAEKLWDTEIGYRWKSPKTNFEMVGFYMDYYDHLVPTGRLNDVGAYTRVNVDRSHRAGIETTVSYMPFTSWRLEGSLTLSENKIREFDEYIDDWDTGIQELKKHTDSQIAFSPNALARLETNYTLFPQSAHNISTGITAKYVGRQYVDNTTSESALLNEYFLLDAGLHWKWENQWSKEIRLSFFLKNVLDHQYESNGWIYRFRSSSPDAIEGDPYGGTEGNNYYNLKGYYPQAGRHFYLTFAIGF